MGFFNKRSKRSLALEDFAAKSGLDYLNKDEFGLSNYFKGFRLLRIGMRNSVTNLTVSPGDPLDGQHGFFDYRYVIQAGNTPIIIDQTAFFVIDKEVMIPGFYLYPEKWHHKINKWFGTQDINFTKYPGFSEAYMLQSEDEDFTRTLFDDEELIRYFEDQSGWTFEATGYYLIMYKSGKLQDVDTIGEMMDRGLRLNEILRNRSKSLYN